MRKAEIKGGGGLFYVYQSEKCSSLNSIQGYVRGEFIRFRFF